MVEIIGKFGKIRRWVNKRIRIPQTNTLVGIEAGKVTTGLKNNFMGYQTGYTNTTGQSNNFMGYRAGYANTSGLKNNFLGTQSGYANTDASYNNFNGYRAGYANITGQANNFIGNEAGVSNIDANYNNFMGYKAGYSIVDGSYNNFLGAYAGYSNTSGASNIFIGYQAGYYETGNSKLFLDNIKRANEADGRIKALIYGVFDAATANQLFRLNGVLELTVAKNGATQAGAGAAANEVWKTNGHATLPDNVLMIGV